MINDCCINYNLKTLIHIIIDIILLSYKFLSEGKYCVLEYLLKN